MARRLTLAELAGQAAKTPPSGPIFIVIAGVIFREINAIFFAAGQQRREFGRKCDGQPDASHGIECADDSGARGQPAGFSVRDYSGPPSNLVSGLAWEGLLPIDGILASDP
jgi:hypothetical protein